MIKISVNLKTKLKSGVLSRLLYTLNFIQNHPCAPKVIWAINEDGADITVDYGNSGDGVNIPKIERFCFENEISTLPKHILLDYSEEFQVYGFTTEKEEHNLASPIDIFQTIFFHISRYEEWFSYDAKKDIHGLMSSEEHFLVRHHIHDLPVVDHLVFYLYELLSLNPKQISTSFRLTHDIDAIRRFPSFYKFIRANANVIFYQKSKWLLLKRLWTTYFKVVFNDENDPYNTFSWLLSTKNPNIVDRKIYFLSGGKTKYENFFKVNDPKCTPIFKLCVKNQYELGIHPSYMSGQDATMIQNEKSTLEQNINQKVAHSRQHFLRYHIKETSKILEKIGISSDSSLGYRNKTGFRCGTGFPYKLYNFDSERPFDFVEIPLIVMDMAVIHQVGWNADLFISHVDNFLKKNHHFTQITFNFHNSTFDPILVDAQKLKSYYLDLFDSTL